MRFPTGLQEFQYQDCLKLERREKDKEDIVKNNVEERLLWGFRTSMKVERTFIRTQA